MARVTNKIRAQVVESTDQHTLQGFVIKNATPGAKVYTDDARAYEGLPMDRESVKHSVGEYVRQQAHINGVESFWSMLKLVCGMFPCRRWYVIMDLKITPSGQTIVEPRPLARSQNTDTKLLIYGLFQKG